MTIIATPSGFTPWAALVPEVAPHVAECPRPIIERALWQAARNFFSDSHGWRGKQLTLLTTVAGQQSYNANPPANAEVAQVMSCYRGTEEIECEIPGEDDDYHPGDTDTDYRIGVSDDGASYELNPAPETAGDVLKGSVAYTVSENATGVPSWAYRDYRRALVHGAAALLVIEPNKPWSNPSTANAHMSLFQEGVRDASNKAGPVRRKPLRVTPW